MSDTLLNYLYSLSHIILTKTLRGQSYCHSHFAGETNTENFTIVVVDSTRQLEPGPILWTIVKDKKIK